MVNLVSRNSYQQTQAEHMDTLDSYLQKGNDYKQKEQWEDAIACYRTFLETNPDNWQAQQSLGDCLLNLERWQEASGAYREALKVKPDFIWAHHNLGIALVNLERFEEAYECFEKVREQKPDFWDVAKVKYSAPLQQKLGDYLFKQQRWEEAVAVYKRVIALNPGFAWGHFNLEHALQKLEQSEDDVAASNNNQVDDLKAEDKVRLIAFFLPQFHPIPENNQWWGKGFTEWTNVTKAKPLFEGHYQPHLPADLGFYDLRVPEVREEQAELAREYGVYGFCYYYYWFAGKRLLHRPVDEILESGKPDFPFCLCWANENWTRRWDGAEHDILIAQDHSKDNNQAFAESLIPFLRDSRYIRVNGKPLILVYRADILPEVSRTTEQWRNVFRKNGIGEVHLCAALTFEVSVDYLDKMGFDSGVEFPPHKVPPKLVDPLELGIHDHKGCIYDFEGIVNHSLSSPMPVKKKKFLTVMTGWDNTARKGKASNIFVNSNPDIYELWLRGAVEKTQRRYVGDERLVFVNAWNEWAEGTHLEPDRKYGHSYLSATDRALNGTCNWNIIIQLLHHLSFENNEHLNSILLLLEEKVEDLKQSLESMITRYQVAIKRHLCVQYLQLKNQNINPAHLDEPLKGTNIYISEDSYLKISGWSFNKEDKKITSIRIFSGDKVVENISLDLKRTEIAQAYQDLGFQHITDKNIGFAGKIKVNDIFKKQEKDNISLWAVFKNSKPIEIANIYFDLMEEEEERKLSRKLKSKIKWYHHSRIDIRETLLDLRNCYPHTSDFNDILDHLENILNNWESLCHFLKK